VVTITQSTTTTGGRDVMDVRPGLPAPMGSTPDVGGTNFAVYSASATEGGVSLCLRGDDGTGTRVPDAAFDAVRQHPDRYEGANVLASSAWIGIFPTSAFDPGWRRSTRPRPPQRSSLRHQSRTPADAGKPTETEVARENIIHRQQLH
jgi:hypothetical protein